VNRKSCHFKLFNQTVTYFFHQSTIERKKAIFELEAQTFYIFVYMSVVVYLEGICPWTIYPHGPTPIM